MLHNSYLFLDIMAKKEEKIFTRYHILFPRIPFGKICNNQKWKKAVTIIAILTIAIIVLYIALGAVSPIVEEQCKTMAKSIATKISNDEATAVMANYNYEDFCKVEKDAEGNITMIGANMITINEVISEIAVRIQKQ